MSKCSQVARCFLIAATLVAVESFPTAAQDPPVFSGPQPGESLPGLEVRLVYGDQAGKEVDLVEQSAGKPTVLVFVHQANRPSIGFTRLLTQYCVSRTEDGLATAVIWLDDDLSEAEQTLKRIAHAMTETAPTGISLSGQEGPGSYGLNRNVTLTVLVARDNKVKANFALTQPSIQADLPKVLEAIVELVGGEVPKIEQLVGPGMMARGGQANVRVGGLLRQLIQKDAPPQKVDRVARVIEEQMKSDRQVAAQVGAICQRVVAGGKLENYGSQRAQRYVQAWAKQYAAEEEDSQKEASHTEEAQKEDVEESATENSNTKRDSEEQETTEADEKAR